MKELFIDYNTIDVGTIVIEDINTLSDLLEYHSQTNTDVSIWIQGMGKEEFDKAQKLLVSKLRDIKFSIRIFMSEVVQRDLLDIMDNVYKEFKIYPDMLEDAIIHKYNSTNTRLKLKELFRNIHNA